MDAEDAPVHLRLVRDAVVLELQVEMVRAEDLGHGQGVGFGVLILAVPEALGDLAGKAGGEGDEALGVLPKQVQVDAGLHIKALRPGHGDKVGEVAVALLILAEEYEMAALGVELVDLIEAGPALRGHVDLAADDGLNALGQAGPVEIHRAVHHAVVRDGAGTLAHLLHDLGQLPDAAGAVQ